MKLLIKIFFIAGIALKTNAQVIEKIIKGNFIDDVRQTIYGMDQKLMANRSLKFGVSPQMGNLFINTFVAKRARIDLNDYYDDFDFGVNLFFSEKISRNLNLKTIYRVGVLKFGDSDSLKVSGYCLKISLNYRF